MEEFNIQNRIAKFVSNYENTSIIVTLILSHVNPAPVASEFTPAIAKP